MEQVKEIIKAIFCRYCVVFTLVVGGNMLVAEALGSTDASFDMRNLVVIQIMSVLCGLGDLFFIHSSEDTKGKGILRSVIHYIYINVVVLAVTLLGTEISWKNIWMVIVAIAAIYWINVITDFYHNKKEVIKMNDRLRKINNNDE